MDHARIYLFVSLEIFLRLSVSPIKLFSFSRKFFHNNVLPFTKNNGHLVFQNYSGVPNKCFSILIFQFFFTRGMFIRNPRFVPCLYCMVLISGYLFLQLLACRCLSCVSMLTFLNFFHVLFYE